MGLNRCHQNYYYLQRKSFPCESQTIISMIRVTACIGVGAVEASCLS